jgi:hypothetical protein
MKKTTIVLLALVALGGYYAWSKMGGSLNGSRRTPSVPTITALPTFPSIPAGAESWPDDKKKDLILSVIDSKLGTYPDKRNPNRPGKHVGTGLHPEYQLREDQLKKLAENYDMNSFSANQVESVRTIKKYNPNFKAILYIDSAVHEEYNLNHTGYDIGNFDDQNVDWIQSQHPDWLLKDSSGDYIRSGNGMSTPGSYWPDPGNKQFQQFYGSKIKAVFDRDQVWDGILIDEFFGMLSNYNDYAKAALPDKYKTDQAFQAAQLDFVRGVAAIIRKPVTANLDGIAAQTYPDLMVLLATAGGGVENEIIPFENSTISNSSLLPPDSLANLLRAIQRVPRDKTVRINSKPGDMPGDVDRTLYAYYTYLLVAGPDREVYWTFKEGDSSIPHYWFREFELDLGKPLGDADLNGDVWRREFEKATVMVNPNRQEKEFVFTGTRKDVTNKEYVGGIVLSPASGNLLWK